MLDNLEEIESLDELEMMEGPPEKIKAPDGCDGCIYLSRTGCDYILIAGHRRGCPPGPNCTRKKRRGDAQAKEAQVVLEKTKASQKAMSITGQWDREKAAELAAKGWNDAQIGKEVGVSHQTIYNWRRRNGIDGKCASKRDLAESRGAKTAEEKVAQMEENPTISEQEPERIAAESTMPATVDVANAENAENADGALLIDEQRTLPTFIGNVEMSVETDAFKAKIWALSMEDAKIALGMMERAFGE